MAKLTPAMQQYMDMKVHYKDCILLFRMGDFYEVFFDDAKIASQVLDLRLTSRDKSAENPVPMAGLPYHSADKYIDKLIKNGYKVAIAEQTSEVVPGQLVSRAVSSIITPGTYIGDTTSDFHYTAGLTFAPHESGMSHHVAWGDFSIGQYYTKSFVDMDEVQKFLLLLRPKEVVLDVDFPNLSEVQNLVAKAIKCMVSVSDKPHDIPFVLKKTCNIQNISAFGKALEDGRMTAFGLLVQYLGQTQQSALHNFLSVSYHSSDGSLILDEVTIKNLELFHSNYDHDSKYSLFSTINRCHTPSGARLLRFWLAHPITTLETIRQRQNHLQKYLESAGTLDSLKTLENFPDIPRLVSRLLYKRTEVTPFLRLRKLLLDCDPITSELKKFGLGEHDIEQLSSLRDLLQTLLKADEEITDDADFITDGYNERIDEYRRIAFKSDDALMAFYDEVVQKTGVSSIKVRFVSNAGYSLEVPERDIHTFERGIMHGDYKFGFLRRQTLKNAQRYTSPYLDEMEARILEAKEKLHALEYSLLGETKDTIKSFGLALFHLDQAIAELDIAASHALYAKENHRIIPTLTVWGNLAIIQARHPVIENFLPVEQQFIPNDLAIGGPDGLIHIITGPNMWGKSTYLRQNAIVLLLAHCGLAVPAKVATIPLVDGIFARIWSGDILAKNQSTFMTEMIEVANILHNATSKSFVIFDELWRGTSTYDGMALTKAILESIATKTKAKTLIATHYHELIALEQTNPDIKNFSVSVYETDKEVVFLKKIVQGGASKSYGIDVAQIAGLPKPIIDQAKKYLSMMEDEVRIPTQESLFSAPMADPSRERVKGLLKSVSVENMTPMQALAMVERLQGEVK